MERSPEIPAGPRSALLLALSDIKIAHSVFAMPFALLGAVMAAPLWCDFSGGGSLEEHTRVAARWLWQPLILIILCMFLARTWAMLVNRLADHRFDAANPRTDRRVFASGAMRVGEGWRLSALTGGGFILVCAGFWILFQNPWPLVLSVPVLLWIALYSYTKRFTFLCHLFLGGALAASPIAAAIAVNPGVIARVLGAEQWVRDRGTVEAPTGGAILLLSAFVLFWVAGFDIAYAMQDIDFDRRTGLHSIPARLGARGGLWVARGFHAVAFGFLFFASRADPRFGAVFLAAVLAVGGLLIFEHIVLARRGVAGLPLAFFTLNGVVSCLLGAAGIADILL